MELPRRRAKSPVTVQEWVAALPDVPGEAETGQPELPGHQDVDNLRLGAEGRTRSCLVERCLFAVRELSAIVYCNSKTCSYSLEAMFIIIKN